MAGRYTGFDRLKRSYPSGTDKTPGGKGKGGYQITPDQFDRNRGHSIRQEQRKPRGRFPRDPVSAQRRQWA